MWTWIIAVIASCVGFLLASLLACARAADADMEGIQKTASSRNDPRHEAAGGPSSRRVMSATGVGRLPGRNSNGTGMRSGCLPVLDNDWREKAK